MSCLNGNLIYSIIDDSRTVFSIFEAEKITNQVSEERYVPQRLHYFAKKGILRNIRRGFYVKENYRPEELANKLYAPSYISLNYVLQREGLIFQYEEKITCVSYLTRELCIDGHEISYQRISPIKFFQMAGCRYENNFWIASAERAFLDTLYLYPKYYFDYVDILDKETVLKLLPYYENKQLEKRAKDWLNI